MIGVMLFTDGQVIAKRLCTQITKTTSAIRLLVKEYDRQPEVNATDGKYPSKLVLEEALGVNSKLWLVLENDADVPSSIPYCIRRQLIDLKHIQSHCKEERRIIDDEMSGMLAHYEGKLQVLLSWSKELVLSSNSEVSRGLLSLVLHKFDELNEFTSYIRGLFSVRDGEHSRSDNGILADGEDAANANDRPSEVDSSDSEDEDIAQQLEDTDVFEEFRSVLHTEYGSDDDSDSENSDSDN